MSNSKEKTAIELARDRLDRADNTAYEEQMPIAQVEALIGIGYGLVAICEELQHFRRRGVDIEIMANHSSR